jgi:predicted GH43/DUF377 family glycosyl hydrolase
MGRRRGTADAPLRRMSVPAPLGDVFRRHGANPILTARMWPYAVHTVFNPAATLLKDGQTLLLVRVEDFRGHSHLCAARSKNGVDGWQIDPAPTFTASPVDHPEELWGIEDPRITWVDELKKYVIAYTAFGKAGPGVALATTEDFVTFERLGLVMQPDDKDAALLPRRIDGAYALVHRPVSDHTADIWLSFSPDLRNWGQHRPMLLARRGAWWDANKVGLSPPLIETERGWLMIYHGVRHTAGGSLYRLGMALFSLHDPSVCLLRGASWLFGPEAPYERTGDVANVVFPCGVTLAPDGDLLRLYYGGADSCVALATGSLKDCLGWLDANGTPPPGV